MLYLAAFSIEQFVLFSIMLMQKSASSFFFSFSAYDKRLLLLLLSTEGRVHKLRQAIGPLTS